MYSRGHSLIVKVWPLFLCFFLLFISLSSSFASEVENYIKKANELDLASDPFWKDLLHVKGNCSQILDDSFFLSERGRCDPQKELDATIEAYFTQKHNIERGEGDKNIVCIFPARYTWLNEKLSLPGYRIDDQICPRLSEWARLDQIEAVSLVYVSGYLGNPASSFGHVLLNFKLKGNKDLRGLFDTSISYGAEVPANENVVFYIFKGLLGGYNAGFKDKFFYAHDQVYSNREFRDMWEYALELSDFDRKMLIYHIAELLSHRYKYYFLSANCAQRVAVLLDIFIKEDVYNFDYPIYIPEELFHRLNYIDKKRLENGKGVLIKSIEYIPSAQRYLFYETAHLSNEERRVYREMTNNRDDDSNVYLKEINVESRVNVLNALLAYQYYKLMASDDDHSQKDLKEYKDKILLDRLRLPSMKEMPVIIPEIPSPRVVSPPSSVNVGFIVEESGNAFTTLGASVFRKESVGLNALEYNELVALDLNLGIFDDSRKVFVDRFDLLKIRDFKTLYISEAKESPLSWRFRTGIDRHDIDRKSEYDYVMDGGVGLVNKIDDYGIYHGFMNTSSHSMDQQYRAGPLAGFVIGNDSLKFQVDCGLDFGLEYYGYTEILEGKIQYQIDRENAVQIYFEKKDQTRWGLSYIFYW